MSILCNIATHYKMFGLEGKRLRKVELGIRTGHPGVSIREYCHTLYNMFWSGEWKVKKSRVGNQNWSSGVWSGSTFLWTVIKNELGKAISLLADASKSTEWVTNSIDQVAASDLGLQYLLRPIMKIEQVHFTTYPANIQHRNNIAATSRPQELDVE